MLTYENADWYKEIQQKAITQLSEHMKWRMLKKI